MLYLKIHPNSLVPASHEAPGTSQNSQAVGALPTSALTSGATGRVASQAALSVRQPRFANDGTDSAVNLEPEPLLHTVPRPAGSQEEDIIIPIGICYQRTSMEQFAGLDHKAQTIFEFVDMSEDFLNANDIFDQLVYVLQAWRKRSCEETGFAAEFYASRDPVEFISDAAIRKLCEYALSTGNDVDYFVECQLTKGWAWPYHWKAKLAWAANNAKLNAIKKRRAEQANLFLYRGQMEQIFQTWLRNHIEDGGQSVAITYARALLSGKCMDQIIDELFWNLSVEEAHYTYGILGPMSDGEWETWKRTVMEAILQAFLATAAQRWCMLERRRFVFDRLRKWQNEILDELYCIYPNQPYFLSDATLIKLCKEPFTIDEDVLQEIVRGWRWAKQFKNALTNEYQAAVHLHEQEVRRREQEEAKPFPKTAEEIHAVLEQASMTLWEGV